MRSMLTTVAEILGAGSITVGFGLLHVAAGLIVGGGFAITAGVLLA